MMTLDEATDIVELESPRFDDLSEEATVRRLSYCLTIEAARNFDELFRYGLPTCGGKWLKGSGGHKLFSRDCGELAVWSSWPDDGDHERYCDGCRPIGNMFGLRELPWAYIVRVAYALGTRVGKESA